jgi:ubiquinone biosynthesis protein Coq4
MTKKEHDIFHNISGQMNIGYGQSTINATYKVTTGEPDQLLVNELQPLLEEAQQQKVEKHKLQKFKQFLQEHAQELQGFSAVCAGISAVCDVIG